MFWGERARQAQRRHGSRRADRGAVAIVLALVFTLILLPLAALAVDIGQQRIARKDAQAVADTAALDAARTLTSTSSNDSATTAAQTSAEKDLGSLGNVSPDTGVSAKVGYVDPSATWQPANALGCDGSTFSNGYFSTTIPSGQSPNAVLVIVRNSVNFGLGGVVGVTQGGVCRSSVATLQGRACFEIGSFAAQINSGNSAILGPLLGSLGSGIDTSVLSYKGLAQTELSVAGLQTALSAGTVDQLLTTTTTLDGFYLAEANALTAQGDTADAAVLNALRVKLSTAAKAKPIVVGDLLEMSEGDGSALGASVNALGLVGGAAEIANGSAFLSVPSLNVSVPGAGTGASTSLSIIQRPKPVCDTPGGGKVAQNAQIELKSSITVLKSLPDILGLGVSAGPITLDLKTASATGSLTGLDCGASPQSMTIKGTNDLLPITATVPVTLSAGALGTMSLTTTITTDPTDPTTWTATVKVPDNLSTTGTPVTTPTGNLNLSSATASTHPSGSTGLLGLVGITLSDLIDAVGANLLGPIEIGVLSPVLSSLSTMLAADLGLTIDGSDVYSDSISCNAPELAD